MSIYLKENNTWKEITNTETPPSIITGSFTHYTNRVHNTTYTNNSGKLIHVSATVGLDNGTTGVAGGVSQTITGTEVAGSNARAFIVSPSNVTTEVSNIRDNGAANTQYSFYNCRFFVPVGYDYYIRVYNSDDVQWTSGPLTFTWSELEFALQ